MRVRNDVRYRVTKLKAVHVLCLLVRAGGDTAHTK